MGGVPHISRISHLSHKRIVFCVISTISYINFGNKELILPLSDPTKTSLATVSDDCWLTSAS